MGKYLIQTSLASFRSTFPQVGDKSEQALEERVMKTSGAAALVMSKAEELWLNDGACTLHSDSSRCCQRAGKDSHLNPSLSVSVVARELLPMSVDSNIDLLWQMAAFCVAA